MAEQVDPGTIRNRIVEIRKMRAADIKGNDGNFRTHPAFQRKALAGVMHEIGMAGVLLAYHSERNGGALTLIDGHLRQEDYGQLEWWVAITSGVGHGFPDLVVGVSVEDEARTLLMEVKRPGERLTPDEARWHDAWQGHVVIVYSIDDALRAVGRP